MKEHSWRETDPSGYACTREGCSVRKDGAGFWQQNHTSRWQHVVVPECKGKDVVTERPAVIDGSAGFALLTEVPPAPDDRVKRLEDALRTIARWDPETFPRIPDAEDPKKTWAYGVAYGSNGERDFMRNIAREALLK